MKTAPTLLLGALIACFSQATAIAHGVVVPLPVHHASLALQRLPLPIHHSLPPSSFVDFSKFGKGSLSRVFPLSVGSGATKAFNLNLHLIAEGSLRNTVLTAPLNNVSGQFNGTYYYGYASPPALYHPETGLVAFGNNPLNAPTSGPTNIGNVSNYLSTGLKAGLISPYKFAVSGAQKAFQRDYNAVASSGYNTGISILQHPTGGVLFGTTYDTASNYPGFFAFGTSPYTSALFTESVHVSGVHLASTLPSYLQFGKLTRTLSNTLVTGKLYVPLTSYPPYGTASAGVFNQGYYPFGIATGSNPFNIGLYTSGPSYGTTTYFK